MTTSFHSPVENLPVYLRAKFEAFTAITQKLVLFLVNMCKDCVRPTLLICTTLRGQFKGTASAIICILHCCRPQRLHYNL